MQPLDFECVGTSEAQEKGKNLLLYHLTAVQRQEYEKTKAFTVTAPSGNKYRIREGRQMNIDVLDEYWQRIDVICFLPEGALVDGDCMLAQKIALETCEELALSVANKTIGHTMRGPTRIEYWGAALVVLLIVGLSIVTGLIIGSMLGEIASGHK